MKYTTIHLQEYQGLSKKNTLLAKIFNTLKPRQNGRYFADDIFKCIFWNEDIRIANDISLNVFLGVKLTIFQHWFQRLCVDQTKSHFNDGRFSDAYMRHSASMISYDCSVHNPNYVMYLTLNKL